MHITAGKIAHRWFFRLLKVGFVFELWESFLVTVSSQKPTVEGEAQTNQSPQAVSKIETDLVNHQRILSLLFFRSSQLRAEPPKMAMAFQMNTHCIAFFEIYVSYALLHRSKLNMLANVNNRLKKWLPTFVRICLIRSNLANVDQIQEKFGQPVVFVCLRKTKFDNFEKFTCQADLKVSLYP